MTLTLNPKPNPKPKPKPKPKPNPNPTPTPTPTLTLTRHAYELEKFLRVAFSHPAVAGITLGDFWDKSAERKGSGLYAEDKAPKHASNPEPNPNHPDPDPDPDH